MNGFRKTLSNDVKALRDEINLLLNDDLYEKENIIGALNKVIEHSNAINCVYHHNVPSFNDLSEIEVDYL